MKTFRDIINKFGGSACLARKLEIEPVTVRAWAMRGNIPAAYWSQIEKVALKEGHNITASLLAKIAESERAQ